MPLWGLASVLCLQAAFTTQTVLLRDPAPDLFAAGRTVVRELPALSPSIDWDEAVPAWNLDNPENAELTVEARVIYPDRATKYFSFGTWTGSVIKGLRFSIEGQRDTDGTVLTDTLRMAHPGGRIQFRLRGRVVGFGRLPKFRRLYITFSPGAPKLPETVAPSPVWGKVMELPQYAQGDYPEGKGLCSPTCVAMVLGYWAGRTGLAKLNVTVPQVQSSVFDRIYGGTGNWAFNTSFAGSKAGMTGFVARLGSLTELERWIEAGVPVICSVSWYLLHGEEIKPDEEGHLVVLAGFMPNGDPVFNDPGQRGAVRKVYRRDDFLKAWQHSRQTTYIICPPKFVVESGGTVGPLTNAAA